MISILEEKQDEFKVFLGDRAIGFIKTYRNNFHNRNCYLKLSLEKYEVLFSKELFELLQDKVKCSLQVMISSKENESINFLEMGGFQCKRKCYEMEVSAEKLQCTEQRIMGSIEEISVCKKGMAEYNLCARFMFEYYGKMHENINPLTADFTAFLTRLPEEVFYQKDNKGILHVAFVEENEIVYVGTRNNSGFKEFAETVVRKLFKKYEELCFECDDCDEAAMALRNQFDCDVEESYNTYIRAWNGHFEE